MRFCPKCGKQGSTGLCEDCIERDNTAKKLVLTICSTCNRYKEKNSWKEYPDIFELIKASAWKKFRIKTAFKILKNRAVGNGITINLKKEQCSICTKSGHYFEGVLQLRNTKPEIEDYVVRFAEKHRKGGLVITKQIPLKNGIDLYFNSNKFLRLAAGNLAKHFGCLVSISPRLQTKDRQSSKDLYRLNALITSPNFQKGDVIVQGSSIVKITSIGRSIHGQDIVHSKRVTIKKNQKLVVLKKHMARVVKTSPRMEILEPETYQAVQVENKTEAIAGEKVKVVVHNRKYYIVG